MTSCYRKANTTSTSDTSDVDGACSLITTSELFSPCCPIKSNNPLGSGNLCLSDYLCWESAPPSGGSGFLTASCTDETYTSGECTEHCTDNPVPDVIYNPDTGLWACCGWSFAGGVDCSNPTTETWPAPAPQVLLNAASSSSSITGTATSTSVSTATVSATASSKSSTITSTATPSPSSTATSAALSSSSSSSSLSTGAKAGISIAVVLGVLLVAFAAFLFWRRGKKSRQGRAAGVDMVTPRDHHQDTGRNTWRIGASKYRDYSPPPVEMHSNSTNELPANVPHGKMRSGVVELQ